MWMPKSFAEREAVLDFTSSSGDRPTVTQVLADGLLLANAIEFTEWNSEIFQLLVCEHCGIVHCEPGNWVAVRSAGEYVLMIPAFSELLASQDNWAEYQPPSLFTERGSIVLDAQRYDSLRTIVSSLPSTSSITPLKSAELMRLVQWEAPRRVLGELRGNPVVERDAIVAASDGEVEAWLDVLEQITDRMSTDDTPVTLQPIGGEHEVVELYLTTAESPPWKAFVRVGDQCGYYLEPGVVGFGDEAGR